MIEVAPYSETLGSEKFKNFLLQPFTIDMLYPIYNEKSVETLFDGWVGKDMLSGWYKFTNDKYILEFYPKYVIIKKTKDVQIEYNVRISIPRTINGFINLMNALSIQLYWTDWIDKNFEPKEYLNKDNIKEYFVNLLNKMDKSKELI